jgi:hypothetical protein
MRLSGADHNGIDFADSIWLDPTHAMIHQDQPRRPSMHSLAFVLSLLGFGLEVAAFLLTVAVI